MYSSHKNMMMYRNDLLIAIDEAEKISAYVDNTIITKSEHAELLPSTPPTTESPDGSYFHHKPLRPLSAYNIFFLLQRERILQGGGNDEMTMEDIPFTVRDMERVVRERNQLWAGGIVVPPSSTATSSRSKKAKKNATKIPSFGELSRRIGLAWKKLDDDTKKRFHAFANHGKLEFHKTKSDSANAENRTIVSLESSSSSKHASASLSEDSSSCQQQSYCRQLDAVTSLADRIISSTKVHSSCTGGIKNDSTAPEVWDNHSSMKMTKVATNAPKSERAHHLSGLQPSYSQYNSMKQRQMQNYRNIQMMMKFRYQQNRMTMLRQRAKMAQQYQSRVWQQQYQAMMMMMMTKRRQLDASAMMPNKVIPEFNDNFPSQHQDSVITAKHNDESYNHSVGNVWDEEEEEEENHHLHTVPTVEQDEDDDNDDGIFNMLQKHAEGNLNMMSCQRQHRASSDTATPDEYDPSPRLPDDNDVWLVGDTDQAMIDFIDDHSLLPYPSEEDYDDDVIWS